MKASILIALAATFTLTTLIAAQPPQEEPLADQVRKSIKQGVTYLIQKQFPNGSWDAYEYGKSHPGGTTALAVLALLNAGDVHEEPTRKAILKGLEHLRTIDYSSTYSRSLITMAFVEAHVRMGIATDLEKIKKNVDHLLSKAIRDEQGKLLGWHYDTGNGVAGRPDNSNTQYALLALWVARQANIDIDAKFWEQVRDFYTNYQLKDGGWGYAIDGDGGAFNERGSTLTMTTAAVCGLLMAQMELNAIRPNQDPVKTCGIYDDSAALKNGLKWISSLGHDSFRVELPLRTYYNLYGIERLGRLSGLRFLGSHDWYREGCAFLVKKQDSQGYWEATGAYDSMKVVSSSFALLFLSKGRTPVLISKLAHGPIPRQTNDQDWNRRRNDLRHLVDFASKELFKKMPLAWQNFDIMRTREVKESQIDEITSEMLQSPIVYLTGHTDPTQRLKDSELRILKKYVENGGFILAVACCGDPAFDKGFHELCKQLFDKELETLAPDHPVWNMHFEVKPGSFGLKGLQLGCKTVLLYSPQNICGFWELNRKDAESQTAFHLGANIIAYATGLEAPKPRLTKIEVSAPDDKNEDANQRGYFKIGQLVSNLEDKAKWTPAPDAMKQLAANLREVVGMDVVLKPDLVPIVSSNGYDIKKLTKTKFLYMHGREDFKFQPAELEKLRFNLQNGGLLFADACCGKEAFDKAFRQFVQDLFPPSAFPGVDAKDLPRLQSVSENDVLFSQALNGEALTDKNIQCRLKRGEAMRPSPPKLEGIKLKDRWVVLYSKYDIGCALERHQSADCIGYSYESALRLGRAAVLYQFRP